jgi:twitching motility two-component system response regulator PilH
MTVAPSSPHSGVTQSGIILFIDDDLSCLKTVVRRLEPEGYQVITVTRAEDAIERLKTITPNLIILDIGMPGMGGLGFLRHLTKSSDTQPCPVIVLTGRHELEPFFNEWLVAAFIRKPFKWEILLQKIRELIAQHQRVSGERQKNTTVPYGKLLLVENDAAVREHLTRVFAHKGYDVCHVVDGHMLIEAASSTGPSVIVIKYMLPQRNGPTLAEVLASHPATQHIPVLLYDETGIHAASEKFPNVRALIPSAKGDILIKAVENCLFG